MTTDLAPLGIRPADITEVPLTSVSPWEGNPRRGDIAAIARSLRRFGQQRPAIVQRSSGRIVAGNHLWHAMQAENAEFGGAVMNGLAPGDEDWPVGLRQWDTIVVAYSDLSDTEARAYLVADNRISELGHTDDEALARWLGSLVEDGAVDEALGYAGRDIDRLLRSIADPASSADTVPPVPDKVWVKPGMLFRIGQHRLLCGDATDAASYERLLGPDGMVSLVWTDPPYGVAYAGSGSARDELERDVTIEVTSGDSRARQTYLPAEGTTGLRQMLDRSLGLAVERLRPGRALYCASPGGARNIEFMGALLDLGVYRQTIVWVKDTFVVGRPDFHWRHELVHVGTVEPKRTRKARESSNLHYGWKPGAVHYFVEDRTLDTVWEIDRPRASDDHPTAKPVELVERSLLASSKRGDIVLDPFSGSGTTLVAAQRTGRIGYAIELDPRYVQVTIERMRRSFDIEAVEA